MNSLDFICVVLVFADRIVLNNGMVEQSVDFSFTESISLDPSFTTFSFSDLPDMESFTTSMSFTPTISFSESFSLPELDSSTSLIDPTSTSDFQMSSTALTNCDPPVVTFGSYSGGTNQGPHNAATFNCVDGYLLVGPDIIICHPNGSWSDLPACLINCGTPTISNGNYNGRTYQGKHNSVNFNCSNDEYIRIGPGHATCHSNGSWSDVSECLIDCGNPNIPNGQFNGNTFDGSVDTVECDSGRLLRGSSTIACQSSGQWTPFPACDYDCGDLEAPENGNVTVECTYNDCTADYACDEGFELEGPSQRQCLEESNGWNLTVPVCNAVDCGQPTPEISNSNFTVTTSTYPTDVLVACENYYTVSGNAIITCLSNGSWSQLPECLYDCGALSTPDNGQMTGTCTTFFTVDCEANFACDANFAMLGENSSTCVEGQGWTSSPPACIGAGTDSSSELTIVFTNPPQMNIDEWRIAVNESLTDYYSSFLGSSFQSVVINSLVPYGTVTYNVISNDNDGGDQSATAAANAALATRPITLLGQIQPLASATINGETFVLVNHAACEVLIHASPVSHNFLNTVFGSVTGMGTLNVSFNLSIISNKEELSCAIYEKDINGCPSNSECTIANNRTYCQPLDDDGNVDAIIGLTVGVLAFLIIAPIVVFCILMLKKQRSIKKEDMSPPSSRSSEPSIFGGFLPVLTSKTIPLRFNTIGRDGKGLYGSEYPEQYTNASMEESEVSSEADYEVNIGVENPRTMMSWDRYYPNDDY